jgi:hypothetical protein
MFRAEARRAKNYPPPSVSDSETVQAVPSPQYKWSDLHKRQRNYFDQHTAEACLLIDSPNILPFQDTGSTQTLEHRTDKTQVVSSRNEVNTAIPDIDTGDGSQVDISMVSFQYS